MSQETIDFYNKESAIYSLKRYVAVYQSYTQFLFGRRLELVMSEIKHITKGRMCLSLLDVACADGIITQKIASTYGEHFESLVGNDIAPQMIKVAQEVNHNPKISFYEKERTPDMEFDICLSLGFISGAILEDEIHFAESHLKPGGYWMCTLVSKYSLFSLIKLRSRYYYKDYRTYRKQEKMLEKEFEIVAVRAYGFFVPLLWKCPALARKIQAVVEKVFFFVPNLYQEKLYVLRKRA